MPGMKSIVHLFGCVFAAAWLLAGTSAATAVEAATESRLTFEKDVVPVLKAHCFRCHGAEKREAELDLRRRFTILQGGDSGSAILSGKPKKSLLIEMIEEGLMPPEGEPRLRNDEVAVLRRWIATGAAIAGKEEPPLAANESVAPAFDETARLHWAFQPVRKVTPPTVNDSDWLETPVDAFTLAELERRNWQPAPPATRTKLIRRVYFDLIGLPPTPEEIAAIVG